MEKTYAESKPIQQTKSWEKFWVLGEKEDTCLANI